MAKSNKISALIGATLLVAASAANAAIPAEAQAALDGVQELATTVTGWMWTVGTAITVAFVGLKLVRKGANKAS